MRSLWTNLRVCWDVKHSTTIMWIAHIIGWGLPALFLAISLPITGVSYQLGSTCLPNPQGAIATWFGWLIAFGCLAAILQFATTGFCLAVYARSFFVHGDSAPSTAQTSASEASATPLAPRSTRSTGGAVVFGKRLAWRRVRKVMYLQWRSIVLSVMVAVVIVYFGVVYVALTHRQKQDAMPQHTRRVEAWSTCLVLSSGDKNQCLYLAKALGIEESTVVASMFMASVGANLQLLSQSWLTLVQLVGIFTFCLMIRWSMLVGWWELLRHPRRSRQASNPEDFVITSPGTTIKRMSLGKGLESEKDAQQSEKPKGVLPEPDESTRGISVPEPGEVDKRHETTNLFNADEEEIEEEKNNRRGNDDGVV